MFNQGGWGKEHVKPRGEGEEHVKPRGKGGTYPRRRGRNIYLTKGRVEVHAKSMDMEGCGRDVLLVSIICILLYITSSIPPALRKLVYFYGVRQGAQEDWDQVLKQLKTNQIASEYQPLLMGLAGSRDRWTLYK